MKQSEPAFSVCSAQTKQKSHYFPSHSHSSSSIEPTSLSLHNYLSSYAASFSPISARETAPFFIHGAFTLSFLQSLANRVFCGSSRARTRRTLGLNTMLTCILQCANHTLRQTIQWVALRGLNSGMKKQDMIALPTSTYRNSGTPTSPSATSACAICLVDFSNGDKLRMLPNCAHRYHVTCIDKWLLSHSSCPTCRHQLKSKDSVTSVDHIV